MNEESDGRSQPKSRDQDGFLEQTYRCRCTSASKALTSWQVGFSYCSYKSPFHRTLGLLLAGWVVPTHAQDLELSGCVLDADTDKPLVEASIAVWQETASDSTTIGGAATDSEGTFTIETPEVGPYTLRISFVGYDDQRIEDVMAQSPSADVGIWYRDNDVYQQSNFE